MENHLHMTSSGGIEGRGPEGVQDKQIRVLISCMSDSDKSKHFADIPSTSPLYSYATNAKRGREAGARAGADGLVWDYYLPQALPAKKGRAAAVAFGGGEA